MNKREARLPQTGAQVLVRYRSSRFWRYEKTKDGATTIYYAATQGLRRLTRTDYVWLVNKPPERWVFFTTGPAWGRGFSERVAAYVRRHNL